jgi:hypothetical protein
VVLVNDVFAHWAARFTAGSAATGNSGDGYDREQNKKYFFHHFSIEVKKLIIAKIIYQR